MSKKKLNGSVNTLATAFRNVVVEAVEPLREDINGLLGEMVAMEERINVKIDTTNENMAKQFAAIPKLVADKVENKIG